MPSKAISWTQQPVAATELVDVNIHRVATGIRVTAQYEVKDQLAAVQRVGTLTYQVASYAAFTGPDMLSRINSQEGT